jgi:4-amino-4-deoxy-L-arabinose transferase-like glycosyltransferase
MRWAVGILALGLALRLALVWAVGTAHAPVDDEWAYRFALTTARLWSVWWPPGLECRPPGYPLLLRGLHVLGVSPPGLLLIQALLGAATVALFMLLARHWMGPAVAVVAGALLAVHPTLLLYTVLFMSETLFLFFLVSSLLLLTWPDARRRTTVAAGVLLGLTVLTRSNHLPFTGMLIAWVLAGSFWPRAERSVRALLLALPMLLTIAPWTVRNAIVYREFIPIDCLTMQSLWEGNNPRGWNVDLMRRYYAHSHSPSARERFAFQEASTFLRAQPPGYPVAKLGRTVRLLLGGGDYVTASYYKPHARFGPLSPSTSNALLRIERGWWVGLTALGLIGFALAAPSPQRTLVALFASSLVLSHWITFVIPRYRVPLLPFLALYAAVTLCRPAATWRPTRGRILTATVLVALFALAVWRS